MSGCRQFPSHTNELHMSLPHMRVGSSFDRHLKTGNGSGAATVHKCEPTMERREAAVAELQRESGATLIPPYNYGPVMCGQGTIALEMLQQVCHHWLQRAVAGQPPMVL